MTARASTPISRTVSSGRGAVIRHLRDIESVRAHLQPVRAYAAYGLAYLDRQLFDRAEIFEATVADRIALVMHTRGGLGPSTITLGDAELLAQLLSLHPGPRQAFMTFEPEHMDTVLATHNVWRPQTMMRMQLSPRNFAPPPPDAAVRRLTRDDAHELNILYSEENVGHTGRQIVEGVYYGVSQRGRLVAAAGTHIYSRREGVAVIGNVFTHQDFRGHGYGTAVTAAVAAHVLQTCDLVVLNVDPMNRTARHIYERLGFEDTGRLVEAMATRRQPYSPLPLLRRTLARHRASVDNSELVNL